LLKLKRDKKGPEDVSSGPFGLSSCLSDDGLTPSLNGFGLAQLATWLVLMLQTGAEDTEFTA
jgi:hypothetical protein